MEVKLGSYRFRYYKRGGGVVKTEEREFSTDQAAFNFARAYRAQFDVEVTRGAHELARLTPESTQTSPNPSRVRSPTTPG